MNKTRKICGVAKLSLSLPFWCRLTRDNIQPISRRFQLASIKILLAFVSAQKHFWGFSRAEPAAEWWNKRLRKLCKFPIATANQRETFSARFNSINDSAGFDLHDDACWTVIRWINLGFHMLLSSQLKLIDKRLPTDHYRRMCEQIQSSNRRVNKSWNHNEARKNQISRTSSGMPSINQRLEKEEREVNGHERKLGFKS